MRVTQTPCSYFMFEIKIIQVFLSGLRRTNKYTPQEIQREIASELHSRLFYSVMMDETTDSSNCEQVVVCLCGVTTDFEVQE